MLAFRIEVDGGPAVTAGVEDWSHISFAVVLGRRVPGRDEADDIHVHLGGMAGEGRPREEMEHVRWSIPALSVGSRVTFQIVETDQADPPAQRHGTDTASHIRATTVQREDRYKEYLALKEEFEPDGA